MTDGEKVEKLCIELRDLRASSLKLAEAATYVIREYDGLHRLSLATAELLKVIGDEGGRRERYGNKTDASTEDQAS